MSAVGSERIEVMGADALSYLDAQCTQDLSALAVGDDAETLVLTPSGEIVAYARVHRDAQDACTLEVPAGTATGCIARLERFAIRTDATFDGPIRAEDPAPALRDELSRIDAGIPGAVEVARALVVHALDEALRARCVSMTKGCYPGQELVARMQARNATPPYVLRRFAAPAACQVGDALGASDKDGAVTSIARDDSAGEWRGLCVIHRRDSASSTLDTVSQPHVVVRLL